MVNLCPGAPHEAQVNKIAITSLADSRPATGQDTRLADRQPGDWIKTAGLVNCDWKLSFAAWWPLASRAGGFVHENTLVRLESSVAYAHLMYF